MGSKVGCEKQGRLFTHLVTRGAYVRYKPRTLHWRARSLDLDTLKQWARNAIPISVPTKEDIILMTKHRVIGYGTYGCVVHPAIIPHHVKIGGILSPRKRSYVSKIFFDPREAHIEYKEFMRVKQTDALNGFTLRALGGVSKIDTLPDEVLRFCHKRGKHFIGVTDFCQMIYEKGDCTITCLPLIKTPCFALEDLLPGWLNLMKGIDTMHDHGMVHGDITTNNILARRCDLFLIDFGHACTFEAFKREVVENDNVHRIGHMYPYYPPESILMSYTHRQVDFDVQRLLNRLYWQYGRFNVPDFIDDEDEVFTYLKSLQRPSLMKVYACLERESGGDEDDVDSNTYPRLFDAFSTGVSMLIFVEKCREAGRIRDRIWCERHLMPVVIGMCHPILKDRTTLKTAVQNLTDIIPRRDTVSGGGRFIINPKTGRSVLKDGKLGKRLRLAEAGRLSSTT